MNYQITDSFFIVQTWLGLQTSSFFIAKAFKLHKTFVFESWTFVICFVNFEYGLLFYQNVIFRIFKNFTENQSLLI